MIIGIRHGRRPRSCRLNFCNTIASYHTQRASISPRLHLPFISLSKGQLKRHRDRNVFIPDDPPYYSTFLRPSKR
jgi:hypothetical protein